MFSLLAATYLWDIYRRGSLSHSLSTRLIANRALALLEAGRISIALIIHSLDRSAIIHSRTLHTYSVG